MLINKSLLINEYSSFKLEILEYCDVNLLIEREQYFIDLFQPEYYVLNLAGNNIGFKHSVETLNKFKNRIRTPEQNLKLKKIFI